MFLLNYGLGKLLKSSNSNQIWYISIIPLLKCTLFTFLPKYDLVFFSISFSIQNKKLYGLSYFLKQKCRFVCKIPTKQ